jgi:hypothetical protein
MSSSFTLYLQFNDLIGYDSRWGHWIFFYNLIIWNVLWPWGWQSV